MKIKPIHWLITIALLVLSFTTTMIILRVNSNQITSKNKKSVRLENANRSLESPDLSSPEKSLATEIRNRPYIKWYEITKKTEYSQEFIDELIRKGWMPSPPYQVGDVELSVKVIYHAWKSDGPEPYKEDQEEMFAYWFRKNDGKWSFRDSCSWNEY